MLDPGEFIAGEVLQGGTGAKVQSVVHTKRLRVSGYKDGLVEV